MAFGLRIALPHSLADDRARAGRQKLCLSFVQSRIQSNSSVPVSDCRHGCVFFRCILVNEDGHAEQLYTREMVFNPRQESGAETLFQMAAADPLPRHRTEPWIHDPRCLRFQRILLLPLAGGNNYDPCRGS